MQTKIPTQIVAKELGLTRCPICKNPYVFTNNGFKQSKSSPSKDHILPKERYTKETPFLTRSGNVKNIKIMCSRCNYKRASFNHCIAALVLSRLIKGDKRFYT